MPLLLHYAALEQMRGGLQPASAFLQLLRGLVRKYPKDFLTYVDGGAGTGCVAKEFLTILTEEFPFDTGAAARLYMYEPLPENYQILREAYANDARCVLRNAALSDSAGSAVFSVPSRMAADLGMWRSGTSYNGSLVEIPGYEQIEVACTTLAAELPDGADVVKLDLQGGEDRAMAGFGDKFGRTKIYYIEHELLHQKQVFARLVASGYSLFFDRLQLGFYPQVKTIPLVQLTHCGVTVDSVFVNPDIGALLWGYFSKDLIDRKTYSLTESAVTMFRNLKVAYLQTDVIAVRNDFVADALRILL